MSNILFLRISNYLLYLTFCILLSTGLSMTFRLPEGPHHGNPPTVFGFGRHDIGNIHFYVSLFFISLLVYHLYLNLGWLKTLIKKYGNVWFYISLTIGLLIVVVPLFI